VESYMTGSLWPTLEQGEQQQAAYAGLGLAAEEYCIMVTVSAHQEKLAKGANLKAACGFPLVRDAIASVECPRSIFGARLHLRL
jgi:hypothetical protein